MSALKPCQEQRLLSNSTYFLLLFCWSTFIDVVLQTQATGQALSSSHDDLNPTAINEHNTLLEILLGGRTGKCQVTRVVVRPFWFVFFSFLFQLKFVSLDKKSPILPNMHKNHSAKEGWGVSGEVVSAFEL